MAIKVIESDKVIDWVANRLGDNDIECADELRPGVGLGVVDDKGKALAGVVFNRYRKMKYGNDVCVNIVVTDKRWAQRWVIRYLFDYAFNKAGCTRMTAVIREGNEKSVRLCTKLGFKKHGVIPRGFNGKSNALVFGMLKEQCKWLKDESR